MDRGRDDDDYLSQTGRFVIARSRPRVLEDPRSQVTKLANKPANNSRTEHCKTRTNTSYQGHSKSLKSKDGLIKITSPKPKVGRSNRLGRIESRYQAALSFDFRRF